MAASLLRKVWESVSTRTARVSGSGSGTSSNKQPDRFQQMIINRRIRPDSAGHIYPDTKVALATANLDGVNMLLLLGGEGRAAAFLEFGNIESPVYSRLRHFFSTIYSRKQVKPYTQPIVLPVPICHSDDTESHTAARKQLNEAIYTALFDMNVPAVCAIDQAVLALFAARQTSGIVVNIGINRTSVVPIFHGRVMHRVGVKVMGMGALKLTGFLRDKMQQKNLHFDSMYTVRALKENLCYVAFDYESELQKDTEASFQVAAEGWFTLSKEHFQTGEILFQPCIAGVHTMGLHQAVALCMDHCPDSELSGDERLEKELHQSLPQPMSSGLKVIPPPYGVDSAWYGAKLISNLSTFPGFWCVTKKQYRHKSRRNLIW